MGKENTKNMKNSKNTTKSKNKRNNDDKLRTICKKMVHIMKQVPHGDQCGGCVVYIQAKGKLSAGGM